MLWNWLGLQLRFVIDHSSIHALLQCIPQTWSSQMSDMFVDAMVHSIHSLWWARNNLQFSAKSSTLHTAQVRVHSLIALSGEFSTSKCTAADAPLLDLFRVPHNRRLIKEVVFVCWKAPMAPCVKVNTNGSIRDTNGACGGLFRDHLGTLLGAFTCNMGSCSIFDAEVLGYIIALEFAAQHGWSNIWLENDSTSALQVFHNVLLVPILLRNRWHNARSLHIQVISYHIFREGNRCADGLANMGHSVVGELWLSVLPSIFSRIFMWTGVVYLRLDICMQLLFFCYLFLSFFRSFFTFLRVLA